MGRRKTRAKQQHFRPVIRSGKKMVYFIAFFPISHAEQKPSLYFPARSRRVSRRGFIRRRAPTGGSHCVQQTIIYVLATHSRTFVVLWQHGRRPRNVFISLVRLYVFFTSSFSQFLSIPHECWCTISPWSCSRASTNSQCDDRCDDVTCNIISEKICLNVCAGVW